MMGDDAGFGGGAPPDFALGKKVFFLCPSVGIQNLIIQELIQQEFEIYTVKDPGVMLRALARYPDSIVFVHINEGLGLDEWESWVRSVMAGPETLGVGVGILSSADDGGLRDTYCTHIGVRCGFTVIKPDMERARRQILEILRVAAAKGRRKYLRAFLKDGITISLPFDNGFLNGFVRDISSVGFSCVLDQDPGLAKNTLFQSIQIKIQNQLLNVEGIVIGSREEPGGGRCYVVLFSQRVNPDTRARIRRIIQQYLQAGLDQELALGGP
jgi:hypothetical protein